MKKSTLGQLAILGITTGLITVAEGNVYADVASFDTSHMIAKPKCNSGPGGSCAGVVAMRDDVKGANAEGREADDRDMQGEGEKRDPADEVYGDEDLVDDKTIEQPMPTWYKEQNELVPATDDGSVKRDPQAPAFNKAGRTNVRMENLKNRPDYR